MVFDVNDDAVKAAVEDGKQTHREICSACTEYFLIFQFITNFLIYVTRLNCCPYARVYQCHQLHVKNDIQSIKNSTLAVPKSFFFLGGDWSNLELLPENQAC